MIGLRIGYALLLLAALGLDLFCGSVWTLALTLLLVLTPLGCIPLHLWAVKQIRLRLDAPVNLGKGETGTLRVQIENKTALPLGLIHVRLRLSNLLTGQSELRRCRLSARPRRTETAEYDLASAHCGRIAIEAACCRIYDPFGLIGIRLKQTVLAQTTVQPKGFAQTIFISPDANCPDDSESYAPDRAGYDLSEVYQLREYRPGDSLRQMHWKLSGKLDRLVIREASPFSAALLGADTEGGAGGNGCAGGCCGHLLPVAAGSRCTVYNRMERCDRAALREPADPQHGRADRPAAAAAVRAGE